MRMYWPILIYRLSGVGTVNTMPRVTMVVRPDPAARSFGAVMVDADDRIHQIGGRPEALVPVCGDAMMFACAK